MRPSCHFPIILKAPLIDINGYFVDYKNMPYAKKPTVKARSQGKATLPIIIVVLIAAVVGGYLFLSSKDAVSIPSGGGLTFPQKATEKDFDFIQDPQIRRHFVAQTNQTSYRTETVSPGSGLNIVKEIEIKGESFKSRDIENDGSKEKKHTITIDDTVYLKDYTDQAWWKQTIKSEQNAQPDEALDEPIDFKEEYSKPNLTFKELGKESCGVLAAGLTCFKYEQTDPQSPQIIRTFWFDDKDYLLRKDQGGFGEFIVTTQYSYDGINISAPSPTKDVPEGKNIYEYGQQSQMPSQEQLEKFQKLLTTPEE